MHVILQDFNFFLDQQPVSASASSRLLAEPEKRKRGMHMRFVLFNLKLVVESTVFRFRREFHVLLFRAPQESDSLAGG